MRASERLRPGPARPDLASRPRRTCARTLVPVPYGKAGAGESLQVPRWVEIGSGALVTSLAVIGLLQHPSPVHAGAAAAVVAVLALSAFVRSPAYAGLCMALVIAATF